MSTTLFIGFARMECTVQQVKKSFLIVLGEEIESIVEKIKTTKNGKHKTFIINFKENTTALQKLMDRIKFENCIKLAYDLRWDRKLHKQVEVYWKVFIYQQLNKSGFVPRIMDASYGGGEPCLKLDDELEEPTLPPNYFGQDSYVTRPYTDNRSVQIANPVYMGRNATNGTDVYKKSMLNFTGTSGRVWLGCSCEPGDHESICENYIPPDDYSDDESDDHIICRKPIKETTKEEDDEEWKKLKATLEQFGCVYTEEEEFEEKWGGERIRASIPLAPPQMTRMTSCAIPQPLCCADDTQAVFDGY